MLDQQKQGFKQRSSSAHGRESGLRPSSAKSNGSERGSNTKSNNYGEVLYQRGMRRKEEMKKVIQRARSQQDQNELAEFSFKPQINEVSKRMTRRDGERTEDFLIKYGKAVKEKIDSQRIESLRRETEGVSFKPSVSRVSEKIVKQKQASQSLSHSKFAKFDSLYQDAQRRQERQDFIYSACIESECTF